MRMPHFRLSAKLLICSLFTLLIVQLFYSCKKSDKVTTPPPAISYKQKVISIAEDVAMPPVKPDSTGGSITEYAINPLLPKGLAINKANGEISGTPSDTLMPAKFVVTAKGPGGMATDTITLLVGTVAFNYGPTGSFTLEINSKDIATTPISPVVLAGTFNQYFCAPSPDSLLYKTGLTFNAKTGQVSGSPTKLTSTTEVPTPVTFTITGISTGNKAASATISFTINDKKPNFAYTYAGSFTAGTSVGTTLSPTVQSTSGTIKKYRLAPGSPAIPAGLALDSLTGKVTGTPTGAANVTMVVRGINTGGYQDVSLPLQIDATAITPKMYYMMSWINGSLTDTLCPRLLTGDNMYVTKSDGIGQLNVFLNPVMTAGQAGSFAMAPAFSSGAANENLSFTTSTGQVSGTPGQFTLPGNPAAHTATINNAVVGGPAGSFNMNIVANAPFFIYNADGGKGVTLQNIYLFVQNQKVDVANGNYPGYTAAGLAPVGGAGVTSYAIYPLTATTQPFANTGLTFNTTTGVISGTPTTSTYSNTIYSFWDYVVVGKKTDGSFTIYKIRIKIYLTPADWAS